MKNQKVIDSAFEEFNESGEFYLVSNLTFEITNEKEMQYLLDKAEKAYGNPEHISDFIDMLIWATTNKLKVEPEVLIKLEGQIRKLIEEKSDDINFYIILNLATVYHQLNKSDKVKEWVATASDLALSADDYCHIIEYVSHPYSGLHLADKSWGKDLLAQAKAKVDDKTYKKIEKSTSSLLN